MKKKPITSIPSAIILEIDSAMLTSVQHIARLGELDPPKADITPLDNDAAQMTTSFE